MKSVEDTLSDLFAKLMEENFPQDVLLLLLVTKKVKKHGINLTRNQKQKLTLHFQNNGVEGLDGLKIELNRKQKAQLKKFGHENVILSIDDTDLDNLRAELEELFSNVGEKTLAYLSKNLLREWKNQSKPMLRMQKSNRRIFNIYVNKHWGKSLDLLEALIGVCLEVGLDFNEKYRPTAIQENNLVFDVLTRLHARGCQVSSEILTLLRNGFADGAHARWRTLHEICTEARFIQIYGNDVAFRYAKHAVVADYQRAIAYREHSSVIGYMPPSPEEFDFIEKQHDEVLKLFGVSFGRDYGWAHNALNKKEKDKVTFTEIEKMVGLSHIRPFYKSANLNVHSGSLGTIFRLGLPPNRNLLVAGPSIYGLAEPGQNTAYSINLLTKSLLSIDSSSLENIGFILASGKLTDEVVWGFDKVTAESENF